MLDALRTRLARAIEPQDRRQRTHAALQDWIASQHEAAEADAAKRSQDLDAQAAELRESREAFDKEARRFGDLELFAAKMWAAIRNCPGADPNASASDRLEIIHGIALAMASSHLRLPQLIGDNAALRNQLRSLALAGLSERLRVMGEPLVDATPPVKTTKEN